MYNRGTNFKEGTRKRGREGKGRRKAVDKHAKKGRKMLSLGYPYFCT